MWAENNYEFQIMNYDSRWLLGINSSPVEGCPQGGVVERIEKWKVKSENFFYVQKIFLAKTLMRKEGCVQYHLVGALVWCGFVKKDLNTDDTDGHW